MNEIYSPFNAEPEAQQRPAPSIFTLLAMTIAGPFITALAVWLVHTYLKG